MVSPHFGVVSVLVRQFSANGVPSQEQARTIEGADIQQAEPSGRPGLECPHAFIDHASANHEMQLVDQAGGEQVVPENVAAKYQEFPGPDFF